MHAQLTRKDNALRHQHDLGTHRHHARFVAVHLRRLRASGGDTVMLMLFHDAVGVAVKGASEKMVPFGPPPRFDEVFSHAGAEIIVCKPCADARGITEDMLVPNCRLGGMNDYHAHVARDDCKPVAF